MARGTGTTRIAGAVARGIMRALDNVLREGKKLADDAVEAARRGGAGARPDLPRLPPAVRPATTDPKLTNLVNNIYKGANNPGRIGNGTTMDAVRNEVLTGRPTGGRFHTTKAMETLQGLQNWLNRNPGASQGDREVAQRLILELSNALKGQTTR